MLTRPQWGGESVGASGARQDPRELTACSLTICSLPCIVVVIVVCPSSFGALSSSSVAPMSAAAVAPSTSRFAEKLRAADRLAPANVKHNNEVVFFTSEMHTRTTGGGKEVYEGAGVVGSISPCDLLRPVASLLLPPASFPSRTFVSILGGCCCGILGLTNWSGFMFYLLTSLLTAVVLIAKIGGLDVKSHFVSINNVTIDGFVAGLMSYVLFWTLLYDIVYVY